MLLYINRNLHNTFVEFLYFYFILDALFMTFNDLFLSFYTFLEKIFVFLLFYDNVYSLSFQLYL